MPDFQDVARRVFEECLEAMTVDGGGGTVQVDGNVLTIQLTGSCTFCPSRRLSAEALVRQMTANIGAGNVIRIFNSQGGELLAETKG